ARILRSPPSISASRTGWSSSSGNTAPPSASRGRKPRNKSKLGKGVPPGAVQVPSGTTHLNQASPVSKTPVPLPDWGSSELFSHRVNVLPSFIIDCGPHPDMVNGVYDHMQARFSSGVKHILQRLYSYYAFTLRWARVLSAKK
ncbi:unnamed protein product, partial [Sphacelaria rigidula]